MSESESESVINWFDAYRTEPEAVFVIPEETTDPEPALVIEIAAVGGGELGDAYADNTWIYAIKIDGSPVYTGADLRSGAYPASHEDMAHALVDFLLCGPEEEFPSVLEAFRDRLEWWQIETGTDTYLN